MRRSFPKNSLPPATVVAPFTKRKQSMLAKLLKMSPQELYKGRVHMGLSSWKVKHSGRNISGRVTVRHRGGGHPQRLRFVDFKRGRQDAKKALTLS